MLSRQLKTTEKEKEPLKKTIKIDPKSVMDIESMDLPDLKDNVWLKFATKCEHNVSLAPACGRSS